MASQVQVIQNKDGSSYTGSITASKDKNISARELQDIYYRLTGKSEKVSGRFIKPVHISSSDIVNLYEKLIQCLEVHNPVAQSEFLQIFYKNNGSDNIPSINKFKTIHPDKTEPVSNVSLELNFALNSPSENGHVNNYKIKVNLNSKLTHYYKELEELEGLEQMKYFLSTRHHLAPSVTYQVEYVEYVIAQSFKAAIDEWFEGLEEEHEKKFTLLLRKYADYSSEIASILTFITFTPAFIVSVNNLNLTDNTKLAQYLVTAFISFWVVNSLFEKISNYCEFKIQHNAQRSYLLISRGDQMQLTKHDKTIKDRMWPIILATLLQIVIAIACNILATYISQ